MKTIILIICCILIQTISFSQFQNIDGCVYGSEKDEFTKFMCPTKDGSQFIVGEVDDYELNMFIMKINNNGDSLTTKYFFNPLWIEDAIATSDGGLIVCGGICSGSYYTSEPFSKKIDNYDALIMKFDSNLNLLWEYQFGIIYRYDIISSVKEDNEGNLIFVGSRSNSLYGNFILKLDSEGNDILIKEYENYNINNLAFNFSEININKDGSFIILGYIDHNIDPILDTVNDTYLLKTDSNGDSLWSRTFLAIYNDNDPDGQDLIIEKNDGSGYILSTKNYNKYNISLLDNNGNIQLTKEFGFYGQTRIDNIKQTMDNNILLIGVVEPLTSTKDSTNNIYFTKIDQNLNIIWEKIIYKKYASFPRTTWLYTNRVSISLLENDEYIISTHVGADHELSKLTSSQIFVFKTDSEGNTVNGISDNKTNNYLSVYPNPTVDQININSGDNFNDINGYKIKIINTVSQIVIESTINEQNEVIDLNELNKGLYFVQLIDKKNNVVEIKKIVLN